MNKPNDYDRTQMVSDYEALQPGGYVCRIVKLDETTSKSGKPMVNVALDILEGPEAGRFKDLYVKRTQYDVYAKWPCVFYQLTTNQDGATNRGFKTFCEHVVASNNMPGVPWGPNFAKEMAGKIIGVVFRREEFIGSRDGQLHWTTKPYSWKSADQIRKGDYKIPEDKVLNNGHNGEAYSQSNYGQQSRPAQVVDDDLPEGFTQINEEDIPF